MGYLISVTFDDFDVVVGDSQLIRDDLGVGRLVALSVTRRATEGRDFPSRVDADKTAFPQSCLRAELARKFGGCESARLDIVRKADTEIPALLAEFFLALPEIVVAHGFEGFVERRFVVAAVVLDGDGRLVGEVVARHEVLPTELRRVHPHLACAEGDDALDEIQRLRPSRAAVGVHGCAVGERADHVTVNSWNIVLAR